VGGGMGARGARCVGPGREALEKAGAKAVSLKLAAGGGGVERGP